MASYYHYFWKVIEAISYLWNLYYNYPKNISIKLVTAYKETKTKIAEYLRRNNSFENNKLFSRAVVISQF